MRYLLVVSLCLTALNLQASPPIPPPDCSIQLDRSTVAVGSVMAARIVTKNSNRIESATLNGQPYKNLATWLAATEGTFTVEGEVKNQFASSKCSATYTVVPSNGNDTVFLADALRWPAVDVFYCRARFYGSSDRSKGPTLDVSFPMGSRREISNWSGPNAHSESHGSARFTTKLGDSDLRLQVIAEYQTRSCRASNIPAEEPAPTYTLQRFGIKPLVYRGDTLILPGQVYFARTAGASAKGISACDTSPGIASSLFGDLLVDGEPQYWETVTGGGVLQVRCSSEPEVMMPPLPPVTTGHGR